MALNPQPRPPGMRDALNPQPLPPGRSVEQRLIPAHPYPTFLSAGRCARNPKVGTKGRRRAASGGKPSASAKDQLRSPNRCTRGASGFLTLIQVLLGQDTIAGAPWLADRLGRWFDLISKRPYSSSGKIVATERELLKAWRATQ